MTYFLENQQYLNMEIFDAKGRLAQSVLDHHFHASGKHHLEFRVDQLPSGTYSIRLRSEGLLLIQPLVIVR